MGVRPLLLLPPTRTPRGCASPAPASPASSTISAPPSPSSSAASPSSALTKSMGALTLRSARQEPSPRNNPWENGVVHLLRNEASFPPEIARIVALYAKVSNEEAVALYTELSTHRGLFVQSRNDIHCVVENTQMLLLNSSVVELSTIQPAGDVVQVLNSLPPVSTLRLETTPWITRVEYGERLLQLRRFADCMQQVNALFFSHIQRLEVADPFFEQDTIGSSSFDGLRRRLIAQEGSLEVLQVSFQFCIPDTFKPILSVCHLPQRLRQVELLSCSLDENEVYSWVARSLPPGRSVVAPVVKRSTELSANTDYVIHIRDSLQKFPEDTASMNLNFQLLQAVVSPVPSSDNLSVFEFFTEKEKERLQWLSNNLSDLQGLQTLIIEQFDDEHRPPLYHFQESQIKIRYYIWMKHVLEGCSAQFFTRLQSFCCSWQLVQSKPCILDMLFTQAPGLKKWTIEGSAEAVDIISPEAWHFSCSHAMTIEVRDYPVKREKRLMTWLGPHAKIIQCPQEGVGTYHITYDPAAPAGCCIIT